MSGRVLARRRFACVPDGLPLEGPHISAGTDSLPLGTQRLHIMHGLPGSLHVCEGLVRMPAGLPVSLSCVGKGGKGIEGRALPAEQCAGSAAHRSSSMARPASPHATGGAQGRARRARGAASPPAAYTHTHTWPALSQSSAKQPAGWTHRCAKSYRPDLCVSVQPDTRTCTTTATTTAILISPPPAPSVHQRGAAHKYSTFVL